MHHGLPAARGPNETPSGGDVRRHCFLWFVVNVIVDIWVRTASSWCGHAENMWLGIKPVSFRLYCVLSVSGCSLVAAIQRLNQACNKNQSVMASEG